MPLNSTQLAALVERARQKGPPVVTPPPAPAAQRPVRTRQAKPAPATQPPPPPALAAMPPAPPPGLTVEPDDFPIGWYLDKGSWQFHRRFFAVFRRPMAPGEYSHLLKQIRRGEAEHLGADCWRVTLPGSSSRTLPIRAAAWRLITILPKDWQPPATEGASAHLPRLPAGDSPGALLRPLAQASGGRAPLSRALGRGVHDVGHRAG
jgi:hypothetical protein